MLFGRAGTLVPLVFCIFTGCSLGEPEVEKDVAPKIGDRQAHLLASLSLSPLVVVARSEALEPVRTRVPGGVPGDTMQTLQIRARVTQQIAGESGDVLQLIHNGDSSRCRFFPGAEAVLFLSSRGDQWFVDACYPVVGDRVPYLDLDLTQLSRALGGSDVN